MSKIHILSKQVAELIAAGEVVERPASVVKEIMENSIDAGASSITLEIKNGGITYIRITDNGSGIENDDLTNAFKSHATSKISDAEDLYAIASLGFRGEALASIAAVSRVEILTRTADEELGSRYCIEGGVEILTDRAGCPKGTTLIIRDLFYNTPARMKFLKKDVSEANTIAAVVDRIALSHPEIVVRFIRDGKQTLLTPGDGNLLSTVYSVFGKEFANGLIESDYVMENIKVRGFVSKPLAARPNRSMQFFYLNGRLIKTVTGTTALNEAYKNSVMAGRFPSCILNIEISPELVDINVHPSKIEARFANEKELFNAVYYCARNALNRTHNIPDIHPAKPPAARYSRSAEQGRQLSLPVKNEGFWVSSATGPEKNKKHNIDVTAEDDIPVSADGKTKLPANNQADLPVALETADDYDTLSQIQTPAEKTAESEPTSDKPDANEPSGVNADTDTKLFNSATVTGPVVITGEIFNTYMIAELNDRILIIDKHAAHERIIYNRLIAERQEESRQIILTPVTVLLGKEEYSAVLENHDILSKAGFELDDFGPGMVLVRECPMLLAIHDINDIIIELAGHLILNKSEISFEKLDWLFQSIACKAAIKAGDFTSDIERKHFVENLLNMPDIKYCPHGRPVYIEMKRSEIEKSFGRI